MVKVFVHGALGINGRDVVGETALSHGFAVDHSDDAVYGDAGANFGPVESAYQRLGQGEA